MTEKESKGKKLEKKLAYKKKCFWEKASKLEQKQAFKMSKEYCDFLDKGRTERKVVEITKKILEEKQDGILTVYLLKLKYKNNSVLLLKKRLKIMVLKSSTKNVVNQSSHMKKNGVK